TVPAGGRSVIVTVPACGRSVIVTVPAGGRSVIVTLPAGSFSSAAGTRLTGVFIAVTTRGGEPDACAPDDCEPDGCEPGNCRTCPTRTWWPFRSLIRINAVTVVPLAEAIRDKVSPLRTRYVRSTFCASKRSLGLRLASSTRG